MCAFLWYWAGLQNEGAMQSIEERAARIQAVAMRVYDATQTPRACVADVDEDVDMEE